MSTNRALATSRAVMGCASSLALMAALFASQQVAAHGYMDEPPSRAFACKQKLNANCGQAEYEPQTVGEAPKGFPEFGPADGQIPSGGNATFAALNAQSPTRWHQTEVNNRNMEFSWFFTAAHKTTKWEYFITKTGWNPNLPLTRDTFELTPFCSVDGGGAVPVDGSAGSTGPIAQKHACVIPSDRSGQHVILGAWTVDDTAASFYDVVDVNITADGGTDPTDPKPEPDGWQNVGVIAPTQALLPGDTVKARAFTGSTESPEYSFTVGIDSVQDGQPENWSFKLAQAVNAADKPVRAGVRNEDGSIEPIKGTNTFYAKAETGVTSYQMLTTMVPDPSAYMHVHDVASEYVLEKGRGTVGFTLMTNKNITVEATVYDEANKQVGFTKQALDASTATVNVDVSSAPGAHTLKLIASSKDGRENFQETKTLNLTGEGGSQEYDAVFPEGVKNYKAGTLVLQEKTGKVYECQPFPNSGYCVQFTPTATQFEPGVGSHWNMAWTEK
ncbi:chitin-binding protein [Pseudomonas taetrolens]|uniref:Chitin-binding protein n=2 Tax=Pseudomonas taetrolens TaxID=47884 RepID=A0A1H5CBL3_PSETA|nr:N-acetylglucosamine-binding protein GbpA [Pseudomonas taetrolens]SED63995.1 chitin-binding protein [Pseudomonas taetrolens]SQF88357.1 n-acetylglucosamine-binding protein a [Pseudomonas taetrolens]VEH51546.1 n-acetylglucosamine-binding protein a [Pseudomonas taetrolens]